MVNEEYNRFIEARSMLVLLKTNLISDLCLLNFQIIKQIYIKQSQQMTFFYVQPMVVILYTLKGSEVKVRPRHLVQQCIFLSVEAAQVFIATFIMKVLSEEEPFFNCLLASFHLLGFLFAFGANSEASAQASSTSKINADLKSR